MAQISYKTKILFLTFISMLAVASVAVVAFLAASESPATSRGPTEPQSSVMSVSQVPKLTTEVVVDGLNNPWDIAFLPDGAMLITERSGILSLWGGEDPAPITGLKDVYAMGEGGLMGVEVDREFETNRYIYTCYASQQKDVRLTRWQLSNDQRSLTNATPIVTDIPLNPSGRHSGCRVKMDAGNVLWIATGDAAIGTYPQDPESLGGKVLRVTRDGAAAEGNLGAPFDTRIFSYGHRNTQGLALYETPRGDSAGFSVEHGSNVDDEVNQLVRGNFGWNPVPFYNEQVAMTDTEKYPDAVEASWRSGNPTIAPSGATFLEGEQWQAWNGALAIAVLKDRHLRLQKYDENGSLTQDTMLFEGEFGRLRSATQGRDGNLYLTTDNGNSRDQIIKVTPG